MTSDKDTRCAWMKTPRRKFLFFSSSWSPIWLFGICLVADPLPLFCPPFYPLPWFGSLWCPCSVGVCLIRPPRSESGSIGSAPRWNRIPTGRFQGSGEPGLYAHLLFTSGSPMFMFGFPYQADWSPRSLSVSGI